MREIKIVLVGLGNLGRRFCEIVEEREALLAARYGLAFVVVGAADSQGAAYAASGLDLARLVAIKKEGGTIADYPDVGKHGWAAPDLVAAADADVLLEASPVNLEQGAEPGLTCIRTAMEQGMHVVTPNKGPLVVAFRELHDLAISQDVAFRYDGTVAGGLPALNVGCRDLRGARLRMLEAVPNLVTGYVMDLLAEGLSWEEATYRARQEGVLEADAAWDLEGWDAAAKLVILVNAMLGTDAKLEHVDRHGITNVRAADLQAAVARGERTRLVARAELLHDGSYGLSVAPVPLPSSHPLGRLGRKQMGVVYTTDIYGAITLIIDEPSPVPSAATMLRDLLDIYVDDANVIAA
ncbi:MAG: homoserine dehydrogenase [Anaerolineae bacterium]